MMKHDPDIGTATLRRDADFDKLTFHPLVLAFPTPTDKQIEQMASDLRRRGARGAGAILRVGDSIIDDPAKVLACQKLGIELEYRQWDGVGSLAEVILQAALPHAHLLSESQRAAIAVPICDELARETTAVRNRGISNLIPGGKTQKTAFPAKYSDAAKMQQPSPTPNDAGAAGDKSALNTAALEEQKRLGRAAEIASDLCHVSARYIYQAKKLREECADLFEQVRAGKLNLSAARVESSKRSREKQLRNVKADITKRNKSEDGDLLIVGDCLVEMGKKPEALYDLIFADPPYNLGWKYDSDPTRDLLPNPRYLEWCERWMKHCARLLRPTGSMFVMIDARWQAKFFVTMENAGLHWRNTIIWRDPFPTHTDLRFQPSARYVHYFTKSTKHFTWNADPVRVPSSRDLHGDKRRVHDKGIVPHDVWDVPEDIWDCPRIVGSADSRVPFKDAPPQVPAMILERIILAASNEGDRVFDPFTGNGTTWRAARQLGRKFTGIERSEKYAAQARQWANSGD